MTGKPRAICDRHNRSGGTPRQEETVKATTTITAQPETTASRTPRQEGIIKEAIGLTDVKTLRARARQGIEDGAMTAGYKAKAETVIKLLNDALATEIVCVLRYKRHYFMATGISSLSVKGEFLQHATEEQVHADQLAERIVQLGGEPNFSPEGMLSRSHSEYVEGASLEEMITEDLIAERIAIDSYREMVAYVGTNDPTTRKVLEGILAQEEEHAEDLASLLKELGPQAHAQDPGR
ncbi:MAG: bacterioferritin [Nitrospiraceae bacterium]|nr:MAG: bacterioferritin [Nitrospiraceae bacterium]